MYRVLRITPIIFLAVLISVVLYSMHTLDRKYPRHAVESFMYLPSGTFLKGAALGYDEMFADLLWIKAVGYFGGHVQTDRNYVWLAHLLDVITTLDPLYQYPYEFGGVVLAAETGEVEKSTEILKKGMKNVSIDDPRYWYLPFFIAFNYMYYKNDYLTAAHYLEQAAQFPKSPAYLPRLVARLYANGDSPEVAVAFLQEMIKATEKQDLTARLVEQLHRVIHRVNMKMLNQGRDAFYLKFLKYPAHIDELVTTGILPGIPVDPRGGIYYISKESRTIENTIAEEDLNVHIRKKEETRAEDDLPLPMRVPEED